MMFLMYGKVLYLQMRCDLRFFSNVKIKKIYRAIGVEVGSVEISVIYGASGREKSAAS